MKKIININYICIIVCSVFFISCKTETPSEAVVLLQLENEKPQFCSADDSILIPIPFNLWDMKVIDDKAVFFSPGRNNYGVIYDLKNKKEIEQIGKKGKGPDEFLSCNLCHMNEKSQFALYDIVKKELATFREEKGCFIKDDIYELPKYEDGYGKPYTAIMQYANTKFLMKEDGDETYMHLMDLSAQKVLASYHCDLRKKNTAYTPYDFIFDFIGNNILLAYCYFDRYEILHIDNNSLTPSYYCGEEEFKTIPSDYDDLMYVNLCIRTFGKEFFILKSQGGTDNGDIINIINMETKVQRTVRLDKKIKLFDIDAFGAIWGYNEAENGSIIYKYNL